MLHAYRQKPEYEPYHVDQGSPNWVCEGTTGGWKANNIEHKIKINKYRLHNNA